MAEFSKYYVETKNGMITLNLQISDRVYSTSFTADEAIELSRLLLSSARGSENYYLLEKNSKLWYADVDNAEVDLCIVTNIERDPDTDEILGFGAEFPDSQEWYEFEGSALGRTFFISKALAKRAAGI